MRHPEQPPVGTACVSYSQSCRASAAHANPLAAQLVLSACRAQEAAVMDLCTKAKEVLMEVRLLSTLTALSHTHLSQSKGRERGGGAQVIDATAGGAGGVQPPPL